MEHNFTLVTGAAGFIGSALTRKLLQQGRNVIAIDCFLPDLYSSEIKRNRWDNLDHKNLAKFQFDMRFDDFNIFFEFPVNSIFNLAAMPGLVSNWSDFAPYYDCNLSALNRILEYSRRLDLKSFVHASTSSVYGKEAVGREDQNLNPTSPYGVSKLAAEKLLLAYQDWYGTPVKILRYFSVYGPYQRPDMAYAKIIQALFDDSVFQIQGDGEQRRSNTYVDDVLDATILADDLAQPRSILNICGDETVSLNQVIQILERLSGKKLNLIKVPARLGDQRYTSGLNSRAKEILNWVPKIGIEQGLYNQIEAYNQRRNLQ
jgi:UDP-glucuronate 4-epimerase